ncbi:MAG: transporter substrate-binding domain-containing protein [Alphaproteobacteria bacterium]|nr:MAG: transporter substrate-binding domain-containing protein [Alphaproteobacteria bacterium]
MTQTTKTVLLSILVSLAVTFTAANWLGWGGMSQTKSAEKESVFDRVMRTKTIRCGYFIRPGFLMKDVNTGEFSGIAYDYAEEMAKSLSLNIEWAEEIGGGDVASSLQSNRIDAYCSTVWPTSARARAMDFVAPIALTPLIVMVRENETRFTGDYAQLNDPQYSASYIDGSTMALMTQRAFSRAQQHSLPQLTSLMEPVNDVANGKADFALSDSFIGHDYIAKNPGKIKILNAKPVGMYTNALFIKQDEYKFKRMLDVATLELINTGVIEKIIKKYDKYDGTILPVPIGAN